MSGGKGRVRVRRVTVPGVVHGGEDVNEQVFDPTVASLDEVDRLADAVL